MHRVSAISLISYLKGYSTQCLARAVIFIHKYTMSAYGASRAHHPGLFVKTKFVTMHCGVGAAYGAKSLRGNALQCGFQLYRFYERSWKNETLLFIDKRIISIKNNIR